MYPPTAATPQVSTNLGPVKRLDWGEGQTQEQACSKRKAGAHSVFEQVHHGKQKVIAGIVAIELSIPLPTLSPMGNFSPGE
jgi:hypothetical protein